MKLQNKKILVTGGNGFIGSHVVENLIHKRGIKRENIRIPRSKELDLRIFANARKAVKGIDAVFHLASDLGGVGYSLRNPAKQFYNCSLIDLQIIQAAKEEKVGKIVMTSSACAYGSDAQIPLRESDIFYGFPAKSHDGYGIAKRNSVFLADIYRRQYGLNAVVIVPNNTYGPGDDFSLEDGHVIPSLIRRCFTQNSLIIWGDGVPTRDFFYVEDFAEGIVLAMERLDYSLPVNLGSGTTISIRKLVDLICKLTDFHGHISFDTSKPRGQIKRSVDINLAKKYLGFISKWTLEQGLRKTISWYKKNRLKIDLKNAEMKYGK